MLFSMLIHNRTSQVDCRFARCVRDVELTLGPGSTTYTHDVYWTHAIGRPCRASRVHLEVTVLVFI